MILNLGTSAFRDGFSFPGEQSFLTYEHCKMHKTVSDHNGVERCDPPNQRRYDDMELAPRTSTPTLGNLDALPFELRTAILLDLDLQSLAQFRTINRRARFLIDNIPEYRDLVKHGPSLRRATLSTRIAPSLPCRTLYTALRTQACTTCGHSGPFIYRSRDIYSLLGCRICTLCQMEQPQLWPLTLSQAKDLYGLSGRTLALIPELFRMPESYACLLHESFLRE